MTDPQWSQELSNWLRLDATPGVGPETARRLLACFGLPENIFAADYAALVPVAGERVARALAAPIADELQARIDAALAWAQHAGNRILTLADTDYPRALLDIPDPPTILYAKGRADLLAARSVAVVGSRNATTQGMLDAERFSEALSDAGLTIVSGLALGIDTAAHRGGLRGAGSTVAVIGTGADIVYPSRNRALAHEIAAGGCIVSEYPLGTPGIASNFPRRNRIISGLARGVLVVEAAARSGSLITARVAAEQGRDVFAIPGSIHSPLSKGCHVLIKQGAKLVESARDVLDELGEHAPAAAPRRPEQTIAASPLLDAMSFDPVMPEDLASRCGIGMDQVQAELLQLEMQGMLEVLPGGKVRRLTLA